MRNPLDFIPHLILACIIAMPAMLVVVGINHVFGTQTVLETHPGTKSVCAQLQYNNNLKVSQCVRYAVVPATCKTTQYTGPIFDTYNNTQCE
jgi:hypothetical protein